MIELMTATRQTALAACPRKHYYQFELALQPVKDSPAFSFGKAWHAALEARANGGTYLVALHCGIDQAGADFPEDIAGMFAGLLESYYEYYGANDPWGIVDAESEFKFKILGTSGWNAAGKRDAVATDDTAENFVLENKTSGESVEPDSPFWIRVRHNIQLLTYADATSREDLGAVTAALFNVVRKPTLKRKMVPVLDENGLKVVMDIDGNRVMLKDGVTPRQAGGPGLVTQETIETVEAYAGRIRDDVLSRPGFYFARRSVPILSDTLRAFAEDRLRAIKLIRFFRKIQRVRPFGQGPETAWPRNCNGMICRGCPYAGPCLEGRTIAPAQPPEGFKIARHQELAAVPAQEEADT